MTSPAQLLQNVWSLRNNPLRVQQAILSYIESGTQGEVTFTDPSNAFIALMESAVTCSTAAMMEDLALTRKQYPSLAQTIDDLYLHMSDVDYLNRFGTPSRGDFVLLLGKDEVISKAVDTGVDGVRKLVIPRDTVFSVEGYNFQLLYPIEIRVMAHGGLEIVYDVSKPSPLQVLESNIVKWTVFNNNGVDLLRLDFQLQQLTVTRTVENITATNGFTHSVSFTENYYFTRAFMQFGTNIWVEVKTTHTDQVYDPTQVTVTLQVNDDSVTATIPPIYFSNGSVGTALRLDVYGNRGPLDFDLSSYLINSFRMNLIDADGDTPAKYIDPLQNVEIKAPFGVGTLRGGSNKLSFIELRNRVIENRLRGTALPITNVQLSTALEDRGYKSVRNVDNITNRKYLATRPLPNPNLPNNASGAGCIMGVFQSSMENLASLETVHDNVKRITITPETLYQNVNGVIQLVPASMVSALRAGQIDNLVSAVNASNYLYSPFHYVYDPADNRFAVRAYYLTAPTVNAKQFVAANNAAAIEVSTGDYGLFKIAEGYDLIISTSSGDSFKNIPDANVSVQLSYRANGESAYAYLAGVFLGTDPLTNERTYRFRITSNWDLTPNDELYTVGFKMFNSDIVRELTTALISDFYVTFIITNVNMNNVQTTAIDRQIAPFLLPQDTTTYIGVTQEKLTLQFGYALDGLWNQARTYASSLDYERYAADVPYTYSADIYERNPDGSLKIALVNGVITYNKLHHVGEPRLDAQGQPTYQHLAGDVIRDVNGEPIPKNTRTLLRHVELFLVDGRFYFATDSATVNYRESIPHTIVNWLTNDIAVLSKQMLEKTDLLFYPLTTTGNINVIGETTDPISIPAEQAFTVQLLVDKATYQNQPLRSAMSKAITTVIAAALTNVTASVSGIVSTLTAVLGDGVKGITLSGFGSDGAIPAITVLDDSQRAVLRKKLVKTTDGTLAVQDDITVDFQLHDLL
jgi:hypothetical protein